MYWHGHNILSFLLTFTAFVVRCPFSFLTLDISHRCLLHSSLPPPPPLSPYFPLSHSYFSFFLINPARGLWILLVCSENLLLAKLIVSIVALHFTHFVLILFIFFYFTSVYCSFTNFLNWMLCSFLFTIVSYKICVFLGKAVALEMPLYHFCNGPRVLISNISLVLKLFFKFLFTLDLQVIW